MTAFVPVRDHIQCKVSTRGHQCDIISVKLQMFRLVQVYMFVPVQTAFFPLGVGKVTSYQSPGTHHVIPTLKTATK